MSAKRVRAKSRTPKFRVGQVVMVRRKNIAIKIRAIEYWDVRFLYFPMARRGFAYHECALRPLTKKEARR